MLREQSLSQILFYINLIRTFQEGGYSSWLLEGSMRRYASSHREANALGQERASLRRHVTSSPTA